MLIDKEIKELIIIKGMIKNYQDLNTQLQSNGFDLTLKEVMMFTNEREPRIDFTNQTRRISSTMPALLTGGGYHLHAGTYLFRANEFFQMPSDIVGWGMPRSSITRCGVSLDSAIIDAGYSGHLVFAVTTYQKMTFSKNARFVQMIFFKLKKAPDKLYTGVYKEERDEVQETLDYIKPDKLPGH